MTVAASPVSAVPATAGPSAVSTPAAVVFHSSTSQHLHTLVFLTTIFSSLEFLGLIDGIFHLISIDR